MSTSSSNSELAKVIQLAWTDKDYQTKLINDPKTAFEEQNLSVYNYLPNTYKKGDPIRVSIPPVPTGITSMSKTTVQEMASAELDKGFEMF